MLGYFTYVERGLLSDYHERPLYTYNIQYTIIYYCTGSVNVYPYSIIRTYYLAVHRGHTMKAFTE